MRKRDRALGRTKCCRTGTERFSSVILASFFLQVSGGSCCFEERPCASGSTSIVSPECAGEQASTSVSPTWSVVTTHVFCTYSYILIYIFSCPLFCLWLHLRLQRRRDASLCILCPYVSESLSLSLSPSITCSSVQDPGGPTLFSMQARSNVTPRLISCKSSYNPTPQHTNSLSRPVTSTSTPKDRWKDRFWSCAMRQRRSNSGSQNNWLVEVRWRNKTNKPHIQK